MKEEIQSLRAELQRTKDPPPHSATTVITVDSSVMVEVHVCTMVWKQPVMQDIVR